MSGRIPARYERLVARQARGAKTSKSDLVARYVIEKPRAGVPRYFLSRFALRSRGLPGGRRVACGKWWRYKENKSVQKTAQHFGWPPALVKRALGYAKAFSEEIQKSREEETHAAPSAG